MTKHSRSVTKLKRYWAARLEYHPDAIEELSRRGLLATDCAISPLELVAVCSLLTARKPIHKVIESITVFSFECIAPAFNDEFFIQLDETIREIELAGLRSHARDLRKLGKVVATMRSARYWQEHWAHETDRRLKAAILDEPFLPQRG